MDPDPLSFIIFIAASLLFGITVAVEIAYAFVGFTRTHGDADVNASDSQLVDTLLDNATSLLITFTSLKSISALLMAGSAVFALRAEASIAALFGTIGVIWLLTAVAQVLIRSLVAPRAATIAAKSAPIIRIAIWILLPLSLILRRISSRFADEELYLPKESFYLTEDGLRLLIEASSEESKIEETEKQMIASILDLGETTVREVMVPRIDMIAFDVETSMQEALDVIIKAGHSRIPVYEENADQIIGLLYAKDLLKCFRDQRTGVPIRELLRPVYFVPASKKIDALFRELQKQRIHMAIIVDEYGGTAGLVTIEDLLEEIVGEIQDEYDADEETLVELIGASTYLLSSRLDIDTLAELLEIEIVEDSVDTLGGLMFVLSGHVPDQGERLVYDRWQFTVLSVSGHRIEQVRAEPLSWSPPDPKDADAQTQKSIASNKESVFNFSTSE